MLTNQNDEDFEAHLKRLVETELVADAESFVEREAKISEDNKRTPESKPAANTAEEDR